MISREQLFTSKKLGKSLSPAQKIIVFGVLITAILFFVYSFIFMTPFSDIYQIDGQFLFRSMIKFNLNPIPGLDPKGNISAYIYKLDGSGDIIGMNMAWFTYFSKHDLQTFNHWIFALGFFGLIAALIPFIYASQKRKIYYKTNLIVNPVVGTFNLYIGIHFLVQLIISQKLVWSQNYQIINAYKTYLEDTSATSIKTYFSQSDSNAVFIIGYIIAFALIVFAIGMILLTYAKYQYQKRQPQVDLSKVNIHE